MPARTPKQAAFMRGCASNPSAMKKPCPSKAVAREFSHTAKKPEPKKK